MTHTLLGRDTENCRCSRLGISTDGLPIAHRRMRTPCRARRLVSRINRGRFVAMTERLASALRKHRHLRSSRVLCLDDGQPITRQGAWSRVRYAAHRANVPTGVHILRHTFCSHLVMRSAAMRAVQELVGHQDLTMTQRYSHLSPAALVDTIRLLESRAAGPGRGEIGNGRWASKVESLE